MDANALFMGLSTGCDQAHEKQASIAGRRWKKRVRNLRLIVPGQSRRCAPRDLRAFRDEKFLTPFMTPGFVQSSQHGAASWRHLTEC